MIIGIRLREKRLSERERESVCVWGSREGEGEEKDVYELREREV